MYVITAQLVHHTTDAHCVSCSISKQIPTFLLDKRIQGITSEAHAEQIARDILIPFELQYESLEAHIIVTKR